VIGGFNGSGAISTAQYMNLTDGTMHTIGNLKYPSSDLNINTNSMVFDKNNKLLWFATNNQTCNFAIGTANMTCQSLWNFPLQPFMFPTIVLNPTYPTIIYLVSRDQYVWIFNITKALENESPYTTGPNQIYSRTNLPCSAFYNNYVYSIGGSSSTTLTERVNVSATSGLFNANSKWNWWGGLSMTTVGSACQQFDRLVYVIGGYQGGYLTTAIQVYDMVTGDNATTNVFLNTARYFMGSVITPISAGSSTIFVFGGYTGSTALNSVEYSNTMLLPTPAPTHKPTKFPTKPPTKPPTKLPTKPPTKSPTKSPTKLPTDASQSKAAKKNIDNLIFLVAVIMFSGFVLLDI